MFYNDDMFIKMIKMGPVENQFSTKRLVLTGTMIWTVLLYWTVGPLYILLDIFNGPQWLRKYKIQPGTNEPVDMNRLMRVH